MGTTPNLANEELRLPLAEVRKDLLDFGLRNPLLNYRRLKTRGVEVPEASPAEVFRLLVTEGAELSFLPAEEMQRTGLLYEPDGNGRDEGRSLVRTKQGRKVQSPRQAGFQTNPNTLPTGVSEKELEKRLLATYYAAKSSIEEQGVNTLFQKASKNAPRNPNKINGWISPIRPSHKLYLRKQDHLTHQRTCLQ